MLTPRENFFETLKPDGKPDRLVCQYEGVRLIPGNPCGDLIRRNRYRGMPPTEDYFGTLIMWPEDQPGGTPYITAENKVIKDITRWREYVKMPDLMALCGDEALWENAQRAASEIDRERELFMVIVPTGVFEQLHFLMGFDDTLANFLLEPEAMMDLCEAIRDYRYQYFKLVVDRLRPDIIMGHDDWGTKTSLFMSPETWRTFIKPQYVDAYRYVKDHGVTLIHHADAYCAPLIMDMAELGVDAWQGVLPQNDIPALQDKLRGRMALIGGIDAAIVDREDSTEEEIRRHVRAACEAYAPQGHFIPCITYGGPGSIYPHVDPIINDEIRRYNQRVFGV